MLDTSVFGRIKSKGDFDRERMAFEQQKQDRAMQKQMNELKIQTAQKELNSAPAFGGLKIMAEQALIKKNMGIPLNAQEEASLSSMAQTASPNVSFDSGGRMISTPSGWSNLGSPSQINRMPPNEVIGFNPNGNRTPGIITETGDSQIPLRNDSGVISQTTQNAPFQGGFQDIGAMQDEPAMMGGYLPNNGLPQEVIDRNQINMPTLNNASPNTIQKAEEETIKANLDLQKQQRMQDFINTKEAGKAEKGRNQIDVVLADMKSDYMALAELDAIRNSNEPMSSNLKNWLATTGIGSGAGQATGSEAEAIRERIRTSKPKMMGAMKDALGLTGTELNSQQELQFYLNALTDPSQDFNTNMINIERLSRDWGAGKFDPTQMQTFNSVKDAEAADLPKGTEIIINGRRAVIE